jgi:hypothetical protein
VRSLAKNTLGSTRVGRDILFPGLEGRPEPKSPRGGVGGGFNVSFRYLGWGNFGGKGEGGRFYRLGLGEAVGKTFIIGMEGPFSIAKYYY